MQLSLAGRICTRELSYDSHYGNPSYSTTHPFPIPSNREQGPVILPTQGVGRKDSFSGPATSNVPSSPITSFQLAKPHTKRPLVAAAVCGLHSWGVGQFLVVVGKSLNARLVLEPVQEFGRVVGWDVDVESPLCHPDLGDAVLGLNIGEGGDDALESLQVLTVPVEADDIGLQAGGADEGIEPFVRLVADAGRDDLLTCSPVVLHVLLIRNDRVRR